MAHLSLKTCMNLKWSGYPQENCAFYWDVDWYVDAHNYGGKVRPAAAFTSPGIPGDGLYACPTVKEFAAYRRLKR